MFWAKSVHANCFFHDQHKYQGGDFACLRFGPDPASLKAEGVLPCGCLQARPETLLTAPVSGLSGIIRNECYLKQCCCLESFRVLHGILLSPLSLRHHLYVQVTLMAQL